MIDTTISIPTPITRPRRLRASAGLRAMVRETCLAPDDFIYPLFVTHGEAVRRPIPSMPGIYQLSVDEAVREAETAVGLGVPAVILFGIPATKDPIGRENFASDGVVQQAFCAEVRAKEEPRRVLDLVVNDGLYIDDIFVTGE